MWGDPANLPGTMRKCGRGACHARRVERPYQVEVLALQDTRPVDTLDSVRGDSEDFPGWRHPNGWPALFSPEVNLQLSESGQRASDGWHRRTGNVRPRWIGVFGLA